MTYVGSQLSVYYCTSLPPPSPPPPSSTGSDEIKQSIFKCTILSQPF